MKNFAKQLVATLVIVVLALSYQAETIQKVSPQMIDMAGAIIAMPMSDGNLPTWCLKPYGQAVSQTTYPRVYAKYGTTYNTGGEGAGNFRLPDIRGRAFFGDDDMGGVAASRITNAASGVTGTTLGAVGGSQLLATHNHGMNSHVHSLPNHVHTIAHTHTFSGTTSEISLYRDNTFTTGAAAEGLVGHTDFFEGGTATHSHTYSGTTSASSSANSGNPTTLPDTGAGSGNTADAGTGSSANLPPAFITTWCIVP